MSRYVYVLILLIWVIAMSCATQTTPMGGPKDSIPPTPERYIPQPNQKNYRGKEIAVTFSEAIQLNNPKEEIIITPTIGSKTEYKLKNNTLFIVPEKPLQDSTTYNINFREGVKDLTEGNPAVDANGQPLHLAFSTGPIIDTLFLAGSVSNAINELIPEDITIGLYTSDTFNIFQHTPQYFTKTAKDGTFTITNLKAGNYKAYAFEDKNKNLKVDSRSEKFGFHAPSIKLDNTKQSVAIALVNLDTRKPRVTTVRNQSTLNTIRINKSLDRYTIKSTPRILTHFANNQSEIIAYYPDIDNDSTMIQLIAHDSTQQHIDTLLYIKRDQRPKIKESFKVTSGDPVYNLETGKFTYSMTYNKPLKHINKDSMYIEYDTLTRIPLIINNFRIDTTLNRLEIDETVAIDSLPTSPKITLGTGFLVSIDEDSSKAIQPGLRTLNNASTAMLILEIKTKEPHYIIEILTANNKLLQSSRDTKRITFKYLPPETVKIRAVLDENNNGKWDTAAPQDNREPEKIIYYLNNKRKPETPLRANWEVGPLIFQF